MRDVARIGMAVLGGMLSITGLALGAAWLIWPFLGRPNALLTNTLLAGAAALAFVYGATLVAQAFRGEDAPAPWPPPWILFVLWGGILALGMLTLANAATDALAVWFFPVLYVLAIGLPVLGILAFAARRTKAPGGRIALQFAYGGTLAVLIALVIEVGLFLALAALLAALAPGLAVGSLVQVFIGGDPRGLGDLRSAPLLLFCVGLARLVIAPLVEEAAKALSLPLWGRWEPTRKRALVWGLAAGLGFALTEGMLTTAQTIDAGAWIPSLVAHVGVAIVQGMTTALVGLFWWRARERGRWLNVVVGYLLAVVLHGFWNLGALARAFVADVPMGTQTTQEPALGVLVGDVLGVGGALVLLVLLIGILVRVTSPPRWSDEIVA